MNSWSVWLVAAAAIACACAGDPHRGPDGEEDGGPPASSPRGPRAYLTDPYVRARYPDLVPSVEDRRIEATGVGVAPVEQAGGPAGHPEAILAARADALKNLAERVLELRVTGATTLRDRIAGNDGVRAGLSVFLRGAERDDRGFLPGGIAIASARISFGDLVDWLGRAAREWPGLFEAGELDRIDLSVDTYVAFPVLVKYRDPESGADVSEPPGSEAAPGVALATPWNGSRVDLSVESIEVRGSAADETGLASIWVRSVPLDLSSAAGTEPPLGGQEAARYVRFRTAIPLAPGKNVLEVEVADQAGHRTIVAVVVHRS
ncbi:MAG: hypothetical protein HY720_33275 [Planctomycetes bacterium]|nr:hypothetical protein [Planctomycetota bacterium]